MKVGVITKSGSQYLFDSEAMTWERYNAKGYAGQPLKRYSQGTLDAWPDFHIGQPLTFNYIVTTPITNISLVE